VEEDKLKAAMATRLVEAMEPEVAKVVLFRVVSGDDLYEAILGNRDGDPEVPPKKKRTRKARADKGKSRYADPPTASGGITA
jgi:hypothetical protein